MIYAYDFTFVSPFPFYWLKTDPGQTLLYMQRGRTSRLWQSLVSFFGNGSEVGTHFCLLAPEHPPREWKHPCTCTLVAHEQCLLKVRKETLRVHRMLSSVLSAERHTNWKAIIPSYCIYYLLEIGVLQKLGQCFSDWCAFSYRRGRHRYASSPFKSSSSWIATNLSFRCVLCLTAYGAWAVHKFIGTE